MPILYKLKQFLPTVYYLTLKSYLTDPCSRMRLATSTQLLDLLSPILYTIYTADFSIHPNTIITSWANDTDFLSSNLNPFQGTSNCISTKRSYWLPYTILRKQTDVETTHKTFSRLEQQLRRLLGSKRVTQLALYKTLLRPLGTYGVELWGSAKPSNIQRIQSFQPKPSSDQLSKPQYSLCRRAYRPRSHRFHTDL